MAITIVVDNIDIDSVMKYCFNPKKMNSITFSKINMEMNIMVYINLFKG